MHLLQGAKDAVAKKGTAPSQPQQSRPDDKTSNGTEMSPVAFLTNAVDVVRDAKDKVVDDLRATVTNQARELEQLRAEKLHLLMQIKEDPQAALLERLVEKLDRVFESGMARGLRKVKQSAVDPYMPTFVKCWVEDFLDAIWPDVKVEAREAVLAKLTAAQPIAHGQRPCCITPRAFMKYTLFPYDRTVWRQMRNPAWWIWKLISAVPRYGVPTIAYILVFFIIDKRDEFQLLNFICGFKALQFVSLGVLSAMIGAVQYYICTTSVPQRCDSFAPQEEMFTLALFVLQEVFIWIAFVMTWFSHKKGGQYHQLSKHEKARRRQEAAAAADVDAHRHELRSILTGASVASKLQEEHHDEAESSSRRRLSYFLIYDLITFLLCAGLTVWAFNKNMLADGSAVSISSANDFVTGSDWKFLATLYWIKALYGLLAFPFLSLVLPGISALVSHARPTGYNPWGRTVPLLRREEECDVPWRPSTSPRGTIPVVVTSHDLPSEQGSASPAAAPATSTVSAAAAGPTDWLSEPFNAAQGKNKPHHGAFDSL